MWEGLPNSWFEWLEPSLSIIWEKWTINAWLRGNLSENSRRLNHQVAFEEEDNEITDLASTMASVSASD